MKQRCSEKGSHGALGGFFSVLTGASQQKVNSDSQISKTILVAMSSELPWASGTLTALPGFSE